LWEFRERYSGEPEQAHNRCRGSGRSIPEEECPASDRLFADVVSYRERPALVFDLPEDALISIGAGLATFVTFAAVVAAWRSLGIDA
jgi:hypothetical protein